MYGNGRYELDFEKSLLLEKEMAKVADRSEALVNASLKKDGTKRMIMSIVSFMPVSGRNKPHAKYSEPLTYKMQNLGFTVFAKGGAAKNKGSFGYLVFPNEGRGPYNPIAQKFFEKGAEQVSEKILDDVIEALQEAVEIEL